MRRFRILMYSSYFPPEFSGAALQALTLAKQLRSMGHQIEFVTQRWPGLAKQDEVEGFLVTRLEPGKGRKHRELRLWWNLYRFLARRHADFDFLHSHGAYYKDSIVGPLARHFGIRSLAKASLANNDLYNLGSPLTGWIHKRMLCQIDACIAISRDLEKEFVSAGVPLHRIHFLPNSVDTNRFRPATGDERMALRRRLGFPEDKIIALYVGVFDERKNIGWLIENWCRTDALGTKLHLVAVGPRSRDDPGGREKAKLVELAELHSNLLQVRDQVDMVADYYRAADLLVLPSIGEGLPNAVLEAMACGLPCVVANASGARELIEHGRTGAMFEVNDVASLRHALLLSSGSAMRELGGRARLEVEAKYAIERLAENYEALYAGLAQ